MDPVVPLHMFVLLTLTGVTLMAVSGCMVSAMVKNCKGWWAFGSMLCAGMFTFFIAAGAVITSVSIYLIILKLTGVLV